MEYVSRRPNLGPQEWIEYVSVSRISPEIARFVFDFSILVAFLSAKFAWMTDWKRISI